MVEGVNVERVSNEKNKVVLIAKDVNTFSYKKIKKVREDLTELVKKEEDDVELLVDEKLHYKIDISKRIDYPRNYISGTILSGISAASVFIGSDLSGLLGEEKALMLAGISIGLSFAGMFADFTYMAFFYNNDVTYTINRQMKRNADEIGIYQESFPL